MTITWPVDAGMGNIICNEEYACVGVNFPVPDPSTAYTLTCDNYYECADGASVNCPTDAECTIYCTAQLACYNVCITIK